MRTYSEWSADVNAHIAELKAKNLLQTYPYLAEKENCEGLSPEEKSALEEIWVLRGYERLLQNTDLLTEMFGDEYLESQRESEQTLPRESIY